MYQIKSALVFIIMVLFGGCVTSRGADAWGDAAIIAEQRAEIERLQRDLADMGELIQQVSGGIDRITDGLKDGLARSTSLSDIFSEIDAFVRELIDENRKLRGIQPADRTENAAEGRGSGGGVSRIGRTGETSFGEGQYYFEDEYRYRATWPGDYRGYRDRYCEIPRGNKNHLKICLSKI